MERERNEESTPEGASAAESRNTPGRESVGTTGQPAEGVLTLVCLTCGTEYFFTEDRPRSGVTCEKCGGAVFREFFTAEGDEASEDFEDSTARELDPDDPEGDTLPGDLVDLNRD